MSRVSHSNGNQTAAANAQHTAEAQQKSANAQGARNGAQFAALYRGATNFTYGQDAQRGPSINSMRARKMADQLARKRRAAKKQRSGGAGLEDDGPDEADTQHAEGHRVDRDGRGGGGGGQSHDDNADDHASGALPALKARKGGAAVPPPAGRLEAIASQYGQPGEEGARNAAIRDAWCDSMLSLREQLAADPQKHFSVAVLEHSMDLLGMQQRFGPLPAVGLAALRDRTAGASEGVSHLRPPERVQRFNLLFPLLWLHADMPATRTQRARALDMLSTLRSGALSRATAVESTPVAAPANVSSAATPLSNAATLTPRKAFRGGGRG